MSTPDVVTRLRDQQTRIDALNARRNKLAGEIAQLERQQEEAMAKLRELGVNSLDEGWEEMKRLEGEIGELSTRIDEVLAKAEAALGNAA